jgi:nicotinate phosphoribosyltransferase
MWPDEPHATTGLLVDLYHLDAAYVSWRTGHNALATFDLYTRSTPFGGAYLLTAGLEPALAFVRDFHYTDEDLTYLSRTRAYDPAFLDELRRFRFTGEIRAMSEGTVAFGDEPLLRVTAPFREALLLESGLLRAIGVSRGRRLRVSPRPRSLPGGSCGSRRRLRQHLLRRGSQTFRTACWRHYPPCSGAALRDRGGGLPRGGRDPGSLFCSARHL